MVHHACHTSRCARIALILLIPAVTGCYTVLRHPSTDAAGTPTGSAGAAPGAHEERGDAAWNRTDGDCMRCHVGHAGQGLDAIGRRTWDLDRYGYDWRRYDSRWNTTYSRWFRHLPGSWVDYYYDPYSYHDPWYGDPYPYGSGGTQAGTPPVPRETGTRHLWSRPPMQTTVPSARAAASGNRAEPPSAPPSSDNPPPPSDTSGGAPASGTSRPAEKEQDKEKGERHLWGRGPR